MDTYKQENLFSAPNNMDSSEADTFGCCSRYRACSDAKSCLIPELEYSRNCIYRQSLKKGHIFYETQADSYRETVYQSFIERYQTLPDVEASLLCDILHVAFIEKRGLKTIMLAETPELFNLEREGFFRLAKHPERVVKKCTFSAMLGTCGDLIETANKWAKSRETEKNWNKRNLVKKELPGIKISRKELAEWIIRFSPETAQKLSDGICFVELELDKTLELHEFFTNRIYNTNYTSRLDTCERDPRFLRQ